MASDYVWAKLSKKSKYWPGKICRAPKAGPKSESPASKWIYFFGKKNYEWVEVCYLKPYLEHRNALVSELKGNAHKKAIRECDQYMSNPEKYKENFIEFRVVFESNCSPEGIPKKKELREPKRNINYAQYDVSTPKKPRDAPRAVLIKKEPRDTPIDVPASKKPRDAPRAVLIKKEPRDTPIDVPAPKKPRDALTIVTIKKEPRDTPINVPVNRKPRDKLTGVTVKKEPRDTPNINRRLQNDSNGTTEKTFGFLGVGTMGSRMVKRLIDTGHKVIVWNPAPSKSKEVGFQVAETPCDLAEQVDIIFVCVTDPSVSNIVFGENGIMSSNQHFDGKGYVEMSCADNNTSQNIADAVVAKGGRYLEAKVLGSVNEAEEGDLILLTAGDRKLFNDCQSCFNAMGKKSKFLGVAGNALKMFLVVQSVKAAMYAALTEALALAKRSEIALDIQGDVVDLLEQSPMSSDYVSRTSRAIMNHEPDQQLTHAQNNLPLILSLAGQFKQAMPITAAVNESLKRVN